MNFTVKRCLCWGGSYQQGWDDCSDAVLRVLDKIKRIEA